ncbi:zinc-binding dehydrogenase [Kitasatospora misakiensis]|uniref:Zinc-binding dehydrogenase n=1 Tax=Kitasatospora misakiensis TaxID=67330 RepID=A0ABW0WU89_9ACTN
MSCSHPTARIRPGCGPGSARVQRCSGAATSLRTGAFQPVVDRVSPFDEIAAAHRYMDADTQIGKTVVTVEH